MNAVGEAHQHRSANHQIHVLFWIFVNSLHQTSDLFAMIERMQVLYEASGSACFYTLPKLVRSASQALIKCHPQNFTRLGYKTSMYFYFQTQVILLFLFPIFVFQITTLQLQHFYVCPYIPLFAMNVFFVF